MSIIPSSPASEVDYAWELATLFPPQGHWSEEAYLDLTDGTSRRIELVDGRLEFLPKPTGDRTETWLGLMTLKQWQRREAGVDALLEAEAKS